MSVSFQDIIRAAKSELEMLNFAVERHMETNPAQVEHCAEVTKRAISGIKTVCIYGGLDDNSPTRLAVDTYYNLAHEIWSESLTKQREMI